MIPTAAIGARRRHFLDLLDHSSDELRAILDAAKAMKAKRVKGETPQRGARRQDAGDDLRSAVDPHRVSFDVAMRDLGGETIMLTGTEMQLGRGESIPDTRASCRATSTRS